MEYGNESIENKVEERSNGIHHYQALGILRRQAGERNGVHIIDLQQTVPMLYRAMQAVHDIVAGGGRVLWVGTKRQASQPIVDSRTSGTATVMSSRPSVP